MIEPIRTGKEIVGFGRLKTEIADDIDAEYLKIWEICKPIFEKDIKDLSWSNERQNFHDMVTKLEKLKEKQ